MLETVKSRIHELENDDTSYSELFIQYVTSVQDSCIEAEIRYMLRYNIVDVNLIDRKIRSMISDLEAM